MKVKVLAVGEVEITVLPIPFSILETLGWREGDELKFEIVTDRKGQATHVVLEPRDG